MKLYAVAAYDKRFGIAKNGKIPWDLPDDKTFYHTITHRHALVAGRKTFEQELKTRHKDQHMVVLTRNKNYRPKRGTIAHTPKEAIKLLQEEDVVYVVGGGQTYKAFLPYIQRVYATEIDGDFSADTFFFKNHKQWQSRIILKHPKDKKHDYEFVIKEYVRPN